MGLVQQSSPKCLSSVGWILLSVPWGSAEGITALALWQLLRNKQTVTFNILLSFSEYCWELPLQMRIMHSWKALTSETITSAGSRLTFHKVSVKKHTFWTFNFFNWQRFCKSSVWREDWSEYIICITSVVRLQMGDIFSLRIAQILWKSSVTFSILGCIQLSNWDEVFFAAWKQEKQG